MLNDNIMEISEMIADFWELRIENTFRDKYEINILYDNYRIIGFIRENIERQLLM